MAEPPTNCASTIGEEEILCPKGHCEKLQETTYFHRICNCTNAKGEPIPDCNPKDNLYPVASGECYNKNTNQWQEVTPERCAELGWPWFYKKCYCCCSCLAATTPVADPGGFRALGDYAVGDQVLAASRSGDSWSWDPKTVVFSAGSPPTTASGPMAGNISVYVEYGEGQTLILTPNQLLGLIDGKLKRADQLVPGRDVLAGAEGEAVPIARVVTGYYRGGIHHIATSMVSYEEFDGSIDGHLINANGVVCGDYLLQIYQDTEKMKPNLEPPSPGIGTQAYAEANPELFVKPYVVGESEEVAGTEISVPDFVAHGESPAHVPDDATSLFSRRQAAMLLDPSIPKRGFSDKTNVQRFEWLAEVYGTFFPDVTITMDWESTSPNVYGWEGEGQRNVFVGGELLRIGPLYGEAMAIAIGFGVAVTTGDAGEVGQSLYDGVGAVMQEALQPYWLETGLAGQKQFKKLLTELASLEKERDPEGGLAADCLAEVIDVALAGQELPPCAGGPRSTLQLKSAEYADGAVVVAFNEELDGATATQVRNYSLSPNDEITSVALDPLDPSRVRLEVTLEPGQYVLIASNVTGSNGSTLDPRARSVEFEVEVELEAG